MAVGQRGPTVLSMRKTFPVLWSLHGDTHTGKLEVTKERIELTSRGYTFAFPRDSVIHFVVERGARHESGDSPRSVSASPASTSCGSRVLAGLARCTRSPHCFAVGRAERLHQGLAGAGHLSGDRRPRARRGLDFERPADERKPLAHAQQAERIRTHVGVSKPRPSSSIVAATAPSRFEITMLTCSAPECLTTFVSASWTTR